MGIERSSWRNVGVVGRDRSVEIGENILKEGKTIMMLQWKLCGKALSLYDV